MKEKKHRHKWEYDVESCYRCGGGEIRYCDCGEMEEVNYKPPKKKKKKSK